ncbi:MAG: hypothetical protein HYX66_09610 [Ignavibacteria bacterium]|nr:hypothetical protein [Ignavibacteria bacterium]
MLIAADELASENFSGRIVGGVSMTRFSGLDASKFYLSWFFRTMLQWRLTDGWVLSPEITFKMPAGSKGMSGLWQADPEFDTAISNREEWTSVSYVSIPILIKYTLSPFDI